MADLESIARILLRGSASLAEDARAEARRVLEELVARGDVAREEAAEIEAAVLDAAEAHRRWLDERVTGPLRGAWRRLAEAVARGAAEAGAGDGELPARLAAIEERLARLERALAGRD